MSFSAACLAASLSYEDNVSKLQQQIEYHLRMVYDLRSQINQYAPISRLPPEMLSRIFRFVRDECIDEYSFKSSDVASWVAVSQVCRHWRDVALNEPSLWAVLPLELPEWTMEMLQRSKEADLSVIIDDETVETRIVPEVLDQAHRLAHLTLGNEDNDPPLDLDKVFADWGSLRVPRLRSLCLRGFGDLTLPERLFHDTVNLRHLELEGIDISWDSHLLKALTTLTLANIPSKPNWLQLRSMLQRMPELQSLTFMNALPSETPNTASVASPIHLSSLRTLCIEDEFIQCRSFSKMVPFSDCLETSQCIVRIGDQETVTGMCDLLSSVSGTGSGKSLSTNGQTLIIYGTLYDSCSIDLRVQTLNGLSDINIGVDKRLWDIRDLTGIKLNIHGGRASGDRRKDLWSGIIAGVLQASNFQAILELDLSWLYGSSPMRELRDTLVATYGALPMLHTVLVGRDTASPFIYALSIEPDKQGECDMVNGPDALASNGRSDENQHSDNELAPSPRRPSSPVRVPFPALRNLKLSRVSFAEKKRELKECLINRSKHGVGILKLVFENCHQLLPEDVTELKDLVPCVYCT